MGNYIVQINKQEWTLPVKVNMVENNIHIIDSYKIKKRSEMKDILAYLSEQEPSNNVIVNRSQKSLIREWRGHNLLYSLGIFKSHTKDVDLDYPSPWYMSLGYRILSFLYF